MPGSAYAAPIAWISVRILTQTHATSPIQKKFLSVSDIRTALEKPRDFRPWAPIGNPTIDGTGR